MKQKSEIEEIPREKYISPAKRQQIIEQLRLL